MRRLHRSFFLITSLLLVTACNGSAGPSAQSAPASTPADPPRSTTPSTTTTTTVPSEPDPFDDPWPREFNRVQLTAAALRVTSELFEQAQVVDGDDIVTVHIQDTIDASLHRYIEEPGTMLIIAFRDYVTAPTHLFAGTSVRWLIERAREFNVALPPSGQHGAGMPRPAKLPFERWGPESFADNSGNGWAYGPMAWIGYPPGEWSNGSLAAVAAHEAFHSVHLSLDGGNLFDNVAMGDNDPRNRARWFIEGTADFFARALVDWLKIEQFTSPFLPGDSQIDNFLGLEGYESWFSPEDAYSYGRLAVEYLVAAVGIDPVMQVFVNVGAGDLLPEAFAAAIGLGLAEFYEIFDTYVVVP